MESVQIRDEFIKLGQALKLAGFVDSGAKAKDVIVSGQVKVNGEVQTQRGKKLIHGDTVEFVDKKFCIVNKTSLDSPNGR